ncbi:hypothetical protein CSKR_110112 [Clonorchis sinensis]|uniref:Protein quiver n=1 Tax=Clonorchis sinensis TaxID=79923 RepID=A0A3R7BZ16_CLOSI|nr:hypothetical protein CSKR_110112 [Clonorchis sinensis]
MCGFPTLQQLSLSVLQRNLFIVPFIVVILSFDPVQSIACYSCVSINGSHRECEDPMSANVPIYRPCRQSVRDHEGLFYARFCSKIKGTNQRDGSTLVLRLCSMERLADVPTHCGQFSLDDQLYTGCVATCTRDWCNVSVPSTKVDTLELLCFLFILFLFHRTFSLSCS